MGGPVLSDGSSHDVLRDFLRQHVQLIRNPFGVLGFLEMSRGARPELKARGKTLEPQHVFERENGAGFGRLAHVSFPIDQACMTATRTGPPMQIT